MHANFNHSYDLIFVLVEIEFAKNTRHKIYEMYLKSNADSETSAKEFIKVCEKYFNTN